MDEGSTIQDSAVPFVIVSTIRLTIPIKPKLAYTGTPRMIITKHRPTSSKINPLALIFHPPYIVLGHICQWYP